MRMNTTINRLNAFLMVIVILFWGSSFVVAKIAFREGLTPFALATYRFLIAGALFAIVVVVNRKTRIQMLAFNRRDAPSLVALALTGVTFFFAAQYNGIKLADASVAAIFVCFLSPIFIAITSTILLGEKMRKRQSAGVLIAAAGTIVVILSGNSSLPTGTDYFLGSIILLMQPILWTIYNLIGTKILNRQSPVLVAAYVNILGGLFLVPFSYSEGSLSEIFTMSTYGWFAILFLSITCSLLGYYLWLRVVAGVGATVTSSFLFAEPLITVIFAMTFAGETINASVVFGAALIFLGVYLVTRKRASSYRREADLESSSH